MEAHGPRGSRRALGWAAFIAAVLLLRITGFGADPAAVGAANRAADDGQSAATASATRALGHLVRSYDVSEQVDGAERCLQAGASCALDDLLDADTTRLRLAGLAVRVREATDPGSPDQFGEADPVTVEWATAIGEAAGPAADALGGFLSDGCAGSIDGVPVAQLPPGCASLAQEARSALAVFRAELDGRASDRS